MGAFLYEFYLLLNEVEMIFTNSIKCCVSFKRFIAIFFMLCFSRFIALYLIFRFALFTNKNDGEKISQQNYSYILIIFNLRLKIFFHQFISFSIYGTLNTKEASFALFFIYFFLIHLLI